MMLLEGRLPTGLVLGVRVIQLDYKTCVDCSNSDMAMFVFVPEDGVSLEQAERVSMNSEVLIMKNIFAPISLDTIELQFFKKSQPGRGRF